MPDDLESEAGQGGESRQIPAPDGLDAIAAEAAKFDTPQDQEAEQEQQEPTRAEMVSSAEEWLDAVEFGCGIVMEMRPELADEWTEKRRQKLAAALAKAGAHYGWNIEKLFGHPLAGLAVALWPMGKGLVKVERARAEQKAGISRAQPAA